MHLHALRNYGKVELTHFFNDIIKATLDDRRTLSMFLVDNLLNEPLSGRGKAGYFVTPNIYWWLVSGNLPLRLLQAYLLLLSDTLGQGNDFSIWSFEVRSTELAKLEELGLISIREIDGGYQIGIVLDPNEWVMTDIQREEMTLFAKLNNVGLWKDFKSIDEDNPRLILLSKLMREVDECDAVKAIRMMNSYIERACSE